MGHQCKVWAKLTMGALLAFAGLSCKLGEDKSDEPKVVELPVPVVPTTNQEAPREPKRYGDQEKSQVGTERIGTQGAKVLLEASDTGEQVAVLTQGTLVARKAAYGKYVLVDYPSDTGGMKSGWVAESELATAAAQPAPKKDDDSAGKDQSAATGGAAAKSGDDKSTDDKSAGDKSADDKSADDKSADDKKTSKESDTKKKPKTPITNLPKRAR